MKAPTVSPKDYDLKPNQICVKYKQNLWKTYSSAIIIRLQESAGQTASANFIIHLHLYSVAAPQASAAAVNSDWDVCWQRWFDKNTPCEDDGWISWAVLLTPLLSQMHLHTLPFSRVPRFPWHPNQGQQAFLEIAYACGINRHMLL